MVKCQDQRRIDDELCARPNADSRQVDAAFADLDCAETGQNAVGSEFNYVPSIDGEYKLDGFHTSQPRCVERHRAQVRIDRSTFDDDRNGVGTGAAITRQVDCRGIWRVNCEDIGIGARVNDDVDRAANRNIKNLTGDRANSRRRRFPATAKNRLICVIQRNCDRTCCGATKAYQAANFRHGEGQRVNCVIRTRCSNASIACGVAIACAERHDV